MKNALTDMYILSNGVAIPCVGFGTWQTPSGDIARNSVREAIMAGYRHVDTAAGYDNEADVAEGIREAGVRREDVFITTKHWITQRGYTKTIQAAEASLKALKMDYIDLYLVHWPCVEKISPQWKEINAGTWRGFEKLYRDGKIRAIGVSNFLPEHIQALEDMCTIKPMVNQIEFHPGYCQPDLVNWCQAQGILVEAWSPLGCGAVLQDVTLASLAKKYGKSPAQICIRFALQAGVLPMPKSIHAHRMAENAQIFDFTLTEADMLAIRTMPPVGYSTYHPTQAPADTLFGPGNLDVE